MIDKEGFYCPSENVLYQDFPPLEFALEEERFQGLLCFSNYDFLHAEVLLRAYKKGIFPWSEVNHHNLVMWFAPQKRPVFFVLCWHPSRSIRKVVKRYEKQQCTISVNQQFSNVLDGCANRESTWITPKLRTALLELHNQGLALSFEVYHNGKLIGGLYGIALYPVFFAESMFSRHSGASKFVFYVMMNYLREKGYTLVDAQVYSDHLQLLGCEMMSREVFRSYLQGEEG